MMSCLNKERKPMVPLKTLDIIFRRRYVPNTQFYFTNRTSSINSHLRVRKPLRPFRVPRSEKLFSYIKYSDRKKQFTAKNALSLPVHLKDNMKIAATRNISERLFVPEPPDDVKAVVEIHPEFYTVIEGRPLRCFDDIKVYINNIRNYAMNRQQIGYRRDLLIKIEKNILEEEEEYDEISSNLKRYIYSFQNFLTEDYNQACLKASKAEHMYGNLVSKKAEFLNYVTKLTILNNKIFKLDAIRGTLKMYRTFLMYVAPLLWREKYDENLINSQAKSVDSGLNLDDDDAEIKDIDQIVVAARKELRKPYYSHMYFQKPYEIMDLFLTMQLQSREYLIHLSKSQVPFYCLIKQIKHLKAITQDNIDNFYYYIGLFEKELAREAYNESYVQEKFFRILYKNFYNTIASPRSLKLKICIEYVYEQVIGKREEGHESLIDSMKVLELMYEDYNLRLDMLDFNIVNHGRMEVYAQDRKTMSNAHKAERILKSFREMTNALNKAFSPPAYYSKTLSTKQSNKKRKSIISIKNKSQSIDDDKTKLTKYNLTMEEKNDLLLFTEWYESLDPSPYLEDYNRYVKPTFEQLPTK